MPGQPEIKVMEVSGAEISRETGAHMGKLFTELSAKTPEARAHRGRFIFAFENLPEPVLVEHPELCTQVLRALAPALRAAQRDYAQLHADPRGRELLRDLLSRATVLCRVQWDGALAPAVFAKVIAALPAK